MVYLKQKQQNKPILTYANKQNKVLTDTYPNIECVCVCFVYLCVCVCVCVHGSYQCQFQGEFQRKSYGTHSQILKDNVMYFLSLSPSPSLLVFLIDTVTLRVLIIVLELKLLDSID